MKNERNIFKDLKGLTTIAKECLDINGKVVPKYKGQLTTEMRNSDELNIDQRFSNKEYLEISEMEGCNLIDQLLQCAWRLGYDSCELREVKELRYTRNILVETIRKINKTDPDKKIVL